MYCSRWLGVLFALIMVCGCIYAQDADIKIILPGEVYTYIEYTKLFNITNNLNNSIDLHITYNITKYNTDGNNIIHDANSHIVYEDSFNIQINKYKTSDTGEFYITDPGKYQLCGILNISNSSTCKNITVIDIKGVECDISLDIDAEKYLLSNETIEFSHKVNNRGMPFIIEYWIEDLFEDIVKTTQNTTNTNKKTWKINTVKEIDVFVVKSAIYPICNDTNMSNNYVSKEIISRNIAKQEPFLEITDIYSEDNLKFGNSIKMRIKLMKNSSKSVLDVYVVDKDNKKVSETTKIGIYDNLKEEDIAVYVNLKDDCNKQGKFYILAKGIDMETKKAVNIKEIECKIEKPKKQEESKKTTKKQPEISNIEKIANNSINTTTYTKTNEIEINNTIERNKIYGVANKNNSTNNTATNNNGDKPPTIIFLSILLILNIIVIFLKKP